MMTSGDLVLGSTECILFLPKLNRGELIALWLYAQMKCAWTFGAGTCEITNVDSAVSNGVT